VIVLAVQHSVRDYDAWKAGYDSMPPTSQGALFARVNRSVDDPNVVAVVSGFATVDDAHAFMGSEDLKAKMAEAGVLGEPRVEIYEEVEAI
jgi:hypothetical protein